MCNTLESLSPKYNKYMQCQHNYKFWILFSILLTFIISFVSLIGFLPIITNLIYKDHYDMTTGCPLTLNNCTNHVKLFCYSNNLDRCAVSSLFIICSLYGFLLIWIALIVFIAYIIINIHSAIKEAVKLNHTYENIKYSLNNLDGDIGNPLDSENDSNTDTEISL